jgi:hypothetical protein
VGGVLIALLRLIEYRFLLVEHSLEIYGGIVAAVFAAAGVWLDPGSDQDSRSHDALLISSLQR